MFRHGDVHNAMNQILTIGNESMFLTAIYFHREKQSVFAIA